MILELFLKGGPVMWPLLLLSIASLSVVIERVVFLFQERRRRDHECVARILECLERGDAERAAAAGSGSDDFVARILTHALRHRGRSFTNAFLQASSRELKRFDRGLVVLDTAITLGPLLGLLGTVVGMITSFQLVGNQELTGPSVITGGIAEALVATATGLSVAIIALIPFNYLNSRVEGARHEIEDAGNQAEILLAAADGTRTGA
jgi:biopolymer transport protein ExbB